MKLKTKIIGILNITPDSFSDGGLYYSKELSLSHINSLIDDGVDIIDIGAESTRPMAHIITEDEEWNRLKNILQNAIDLARDKKIEISIDTRNAKTAEKAISLGVDYINDVSAATDKYMIEVIKNSNVKFIINHNLGIPANRNKIISQNVDPIAIVIKQLQEIILELINNNIEKHRIIVDPGIGFGKDSKQSWNIIQNIEQIKILNSPICVGHSRKSMFSSISQNNHSRDIATLAVSAFLLQKNIDYIRVHNVKLHKEFLETWKKLL